MNIRRIVLLLLFLLCVTAATAESATETDLSRTVTRSPLLDDALAMLEEGNGIVARYNQLAGADVVAYFPEGVPYFFGGQRRDWVFVKWPDMVVRAASQNSLYYKEGRRYFSGFDCSGFVSAVYLEAGDPIHGRVSNRLGMSWCSKGHLFCSHDKPMPEDWAELATQLQVGDLFIFRHPGYHVMMFIGTLRSYGYTAADCEALAPYLDYPLMIHCSNAPGYTERFQEKIKTSERNDIRQLVQPPDGGVSIAILGVPTSAADQEGQILDAYLYWCVLEPDTAPCPVTLEDLSTMTDYAWHRPSGSSK